MSSSNDINVRLHIERLVLDGFTMTPAQRAQLVNAAQEELGWLLANKGMSESMAGGFSTPVIDGGVIQQSAASFEPVSFGRDLARTLYGSLGGRNE
jgi:hypothetical protein